LPIIFVVEAVDGNRHFDNSYFSDSSAYSNSGISTYCCRDTVYLEFLPRNGPRIG
jgi:hypothetical protein